MKLISWEQFVASCWVKDTLPFFKRYVLLQEDFYLLVEIK